MMMNSSETLWKKGQIAITTDLGEELYTWEAKVYDEGSKYGVNGGRVSKLQVCSGDSSCVCNYDRGWDIRPSSYAEWQIVNYICNVVYGVDNESLHKDYFCFLINDWLEAEFSDADIGKLQERVREMGVSQLYERYMFSEENLCSYDELTEIINNLVAAPKWAAEGGKYE